MFLFPILPRRRVRSTALALLALTASLAMLGCGKGSSGPTDTGPDLPDPDEPAPPGWAGPAPVGEVLYAVDLGNNFLVFGTESFDALTAKMRIQGLPFLKRIIGITIRPSDGKLYGVGNDSRVYTIDPLTAVATPVSSTPFSPGIVSAFEIHFAMDLEPGGDRVRLISVESGGNWSISLDDGTAIAGESARYAPGTPLAGQAPRLLGFAFAPPADPTDTGICRNLAYGVDADQAIMVASCDPATGLWWPTVEDEPAQTSLSYRGTGPSLSGSGAPREFEELKDQLMRCGEFMFEPGGPLGPELPGEPGPNEDGLWGPRTPPGPFTVFLVTEGRNVLASLEKLGVDVKVTITEHGDIVSNEPIQSVEWVHPEYVPHPVPQRLRRDVRPDLRISAATVQADPGPPTGDPRARCS